MHRNLFARELTHDSITQRLPHLIDQFRLRNPADLGLGISKSREVKLAGRRGILDEHHVAFIELGR